MTQPKIACPHCGEFLSHVIDSGDDLMSATEKIIMAKRYSRQVPLGSAAPGGNAGMTKIAEGVDFNLF